MTAVKARTERAVFVLEWERRKSCESSATRMVCMRLATTAAQTLWDEDQRALNQTKEVPESRAASP